MADVSVVIVGAGVSGLGAAVTLAKEGLKDVMILEAGNRVGGRIRSIPYASGYLELGAQWVHGEVGNAMYEVAYPLGALEEVDDYLGFKGAASFIFEDGSLVPPETAERLELLATFLLAEGEEDEIEIQELGDIVSVLPAMPCDFASKAEEVDWRLQHILPVLCPDLSPQQQEHVASWFRRFLNSIDACDKWGEVPVDDEYVMCPGNPVINWKTGYSTIVRHLQSELPPEVDLRLESRVVNIDYGAPDRPRVSYVDKAGKRCTVSCDQVIVTLPLGILKRGIRNGLFSPTLPDWKRHAVEGLEFGATEKVFLTWDQPWWPPEEPSGGLKEGLSFCWAADPPRVGDGEGDLRWWTEILGFYVVHGQPNTLVGWITGEAARQMAEASDEEVTRRCMEVIRRFCRSFGPIPDPIDMVRSSWARDPNFMGAYSYPSLRTAEKGHSFESLSRPVGCPPRLFFAGEATVKEHYGTTHAALGSGRREAKRVLVARRPPERTDVVVVGAGVSGLAAANALLKASEGKLRLLLLEGQDRVGGRVWTSRMGEEDRVIELGAQWIHGQKGNPVFKFASRHGLVNRQRSVEAEGRFVTQDGVEVSPDLVEKVRAFIADTYDACDGFADGTRSDAQEFSSVGHFFRTSWDKQLQQWGIPTGDLKDLYHAVFEYFMIFERIDNACDSVDLLSLTSWGEFEDLPGETYNNIVNGYQSVLHELLEGIPPECLRLNAEVDSVHWKGGCNAESVENNNCEEDEPSAYDNEGDTPAFRTTTTPSAPEANRNLVVDSKRSSGEGLVKCLLHDGQIIECDHIIVTASLGFLKENYQRFFQPRLPLKLENAIKELGFGVVDKIFIEFEEAFWEPECYGIQLVWTDHMEKQGRREWVRGISGFDRVVGHPRTLLAWLSGPEAKAMESLSESEVEKDIRNLLTRFLKTDSLPRIKNIVRSDWHSNRLIRGSYSYRGVQADGKGVKALDLLNPVMKALPGGKRSVPVILMAGEGTSHAHYSTVHGAFNSGVRAARKLLKFRAFC